MSPSDEEFDGTALLANKSSSHSTASAVFQQTSTDSMLDAVVANVILSPDTAKTTKSKRKRKALSTSSPKKQKPMIKIPQVKEHDVIKEQCRVQESSLAVARSEIHFVDAQLQLEQLVPYTFYREICQKHVDDFVRLLREKKFDFKLCIFTVCQHSDGRKFIVLDGNHRLAAMLIAFAGGSCQVSCRMIQKVLTNSQMLALCHDLTKPSQSLELRFLDQVSILRNFMGEKNIKTSSRVYPEQVEMAKKLAYGANEYVVEVAQLPENDYKVVFQYLKAFQNDQVPDYPGATFHHHAYLTHSTNLPDLKANSFWKKLFRLYKKNTKLVMTALMPKEDGTFRTLKEVVEHFTNPPRFLDALNSLGIVYFNLEVASEALAGGIFTDNQLYTALKNRSRFAHVGNGTQMCTEEQIKVKLQAILKDSIVVVDESTFISYTLESFTDVLTSSSFFFIYRPWLTDELLEKVVACLKPDGLLIILGQVDLKDFCSALNFTKPTINFTIMLEECISEVIHDEPYDNSMDVSIFVVKQSLVVPMEVAFGDRVPKLTLNKIVTTESFNQIFATILPLEGICKRDVMVVAPPASKTKHFTQVVNLMFETKRAKFIYFTEEDRKAIRNCINEVVSTPISTSNVKESTKDLGTTMEVATDSHSSPAVIHSPTAASQDASLNQS